MDMSKNGLEQHCKSMETKKGQKLSDGEGVQGTRNLEEKVMQNYYGLAREGDSPFPIFCMETGAERTHESEALCEEIQHGCPS